MYTQFGPKGGGGERLVRSVCGLVNTRGKGRLSSTSGSKDGSTDRHSVLGRVLRGLSRWLSGKIDTRSFSWLLLQ